MANMTILKKKLLIQTECLANIAVFLVATLGQLASQSNILQNFLANITSQGSALWPQVQ